MFNCLVSPFETSLWDPSQERSIWMSYLLFQGARQVQSLHQWSVRISRGWRDRTLNKEVISVSSIAGKWKGINLVLQDEPHWRPETRRAAGHDWEPWVLCPTLVASAAIHSPSFAWLGKWVQSRKDLGFAFCHTAVSVNWGSTVLPISLFQTWLLLCVASQAGRTVSMPWRIEACLRLLPWPLSLWVLEDSCDTEAEMAWLAIVKCRVPYPGTWLVHTTWIPLYPFLTRAMNCSVDILALSSGLGLSPKTADLEENMRTLTGYFFIFMACLWDK